MATRKAFWQQRLDERLEARAGGPRFDWGAVWGVVSRLLLWLFAGALIVAALFRLLIVPVLYSPGLFADGLADPIARLLAYQCQVTGQCDLRYLLAGLVLAVLVATLAATLILGPLAMMLSNREDADEVSEDELLEGLSALDERLANLRADLVLAGVVKLRPDETEGEQ